MLLRILIFVTLAYLNLSSVGAVKRGLKEVLFAAIAVAVGASCLLFLMTVSNTTQVRIKALA